MQGENERQWKKSERKKRVTKKFLEVSRCSRAKQRQRNVQKSVLHVQSCFFCFRRCLRSLALHEFINFLTNYKYEKIKNKIYT